MIKSSNKITCRWVFSLKENENCEIARYKTHLITQGCCQIKGVNYGVFSPVVNFSIVRLFLALFVNLLKWKHFQLDIKSAYSYTPLTGQIYMRQSTGYDSKHNPNYVCLLKKAIYGLHQSGRQ